VDETIGEDEQRVFPDAPWHLQGAACMSLWRVPVRELGQLAPIPDLRLTTVAGNAFIATVWARYSDGSLRYDELAIAVLVRGSGLLVPAGSVTAIWVNNPVSAEGGRYLWHIPKELADFETLASDRQFTGTMALDDQPVAQLHFEAGAAVPGRLRASGFVIQPGAGGPLRTRCTARGGLRLGRAQWTISPSGPLAVLHGRQPLLSVSVNAMDAEFGV
jgi:hypothetical protein